MDVAKMRRMREELELLHKEAATREKKLAAGAALDYLDAGKNDEAMEILAKMVAYLPDSWRGY